MLFDDDSWGGSTKAAIRLLCVFNVFSDTGWCAILAPALTEAKIERPTVPCIQ